MSSLPMIADRFRRELAHMLHLNKKAEIQILSSVPAGTSQDMETDESEQQGPGGRPLEGLMAYVVGRIKAAA